MFRYSVRPGTVAAKYNDDVPEEDKIRRLNKLIGIQQDIGHQVNQREVGVVQTALVEGKSRRNDKVSRARTERNKIVLIDAPDLEVGSVVSVNVTRADAFTLHGSKVALN